jgi:peroxiredoxin
MAHGVRVFAVSADPPDVASGLKAELGIPFHLLSDDEQRLAVDLCGVNAHCEIIADRQGVVRWVGLNDNWRAKLRPEAVFQAAYRSDNL